mmetsp:Transcript_1806/g.4166  ORF Transcript_1806/g.4166 Transcript_1806/m.4166 type:complete len:505 (-) Transcript_1806:107-1621(-)|eukprot:CAMPEP_0114514290 /NCGR_PEP_ID=MMETSP0109-20121206/16070_1 /TAXON_ID=29199 /ORGANISM="Chlorarachnion reptans, Strain CCCM449" /LENGTH=504 /DNA_ID=CAMNT_0001694311 /DNA_START=139 /DNA_END=1653 /DNA_ORIENTATION=-
MEVAHKQAWERIQQRVEWLGFDMDHTLVQYHIPNTYKLIHKLLVRTLCDMGFPKKIFDVPFDPSFVGKGLILDFSTGDLIQLDGKGYVCAARHGMKKILTADEISQKYSIQWKHMYELKERVRNPAYKPFLTHFDTPAQHVCGLLVDYYDSKKWKKYDFWPKVLQGFIDNFSATCFRDDSGIFFPEIKKNPSNYIIPRPEIAKWLTKLRKDGKGLFMVTNSQADFSEFLMTFCFGRKWRDLFDLVIYYSGKGRGFFTEENEFLEVDKKDPHASKKSIQPFLGAGAEFIAGNAEALSRLFKVNRKEALKISTERRKAQQHIGSKSALISPGPKSQSTLSTTGATVQGQYENSTSSRQVPASPSEMSQMSRSNILNTSNSFTKGSISHLQNEEEIYPHVNQNAGGRICYVGDHLHGDIVACRANLADWETVLIMEEAAPKVEIESDCPKGFRQMFTSDSKENKTGGDAAASQDEDGRQSDELSTYFGMLSIKTSTVVLPSVSSMVS